MKKMQSLAADEYGTNTKMQQATESYQGFILLFVAIKKLFGFWLIITH